MIFNQLKKYDSYENSSIAIIADHGFHNKIPPCTVRKTVHLRKTLLDLSISICQSASALCGAGAAAAIGQFGVTYAYRFAAPRDIALLDYSNVFFAAMLGWTFFGQTPDVLSWAGYAAIFLSAAAMSRIRG